MSKEINIEELINSGALLEQPDAGGRTSVPLNESSPEEYVLKGLDIKDPLELLTILDEDVASGRVKLYKWQVQILTDFAVGGSSAKMPLKQVIRAANGSGKDKYIISACVVWLCMAHVKARAVVTSASGQQLDNQTAAYVYDLCKAANRVFGSIFGRDVWKINYRYCECLATGSPISMFATDEPKKAEGYHPLQAGAKMGIFVSEDKTVPDDINDALTRCSGYTHRMHVSTPGEPAGHFYDYCTNALKRDDLATVVLQPHWIEYHITAFDCGHFGPDHFIEVENKSPGGKTGAYYLSVIMAEFGGNTAGVAIPGIYVNRCLGDAVEWRHSTHNDAGLDLSDGGDECVLAVRNGNKLLYLFTFRLDNTQDTVKLLDQKFREYNLDNPESRINGDCVGNGKPILDQLRGMGWQNIFYIDARNTPKEKLVYKNRNSELWFHMRKLCERTEVSLLDDYKLKKQLSSRYYMVKSGLFQMESKQEARAHGHPSPDRADAVIYAFWDYSGVWKAPEVKKPFEVAKPVGASGFTATFDGRVAAKVQDSKYTRTPSAGKDFSFIQDLVQEHNNLVRSIESN